MKRILVLLLAALMLLSMAACSDPAEPQESTPAGNEIVYENHDYPLGDVSDRLKLLGRSEYGDQGVICDLSASGVEFSMYIEGRLTLEINCSKDTYFTVYIDGVRQEERLKVTGGFVDQNVEIANFDTMALRNIRIVKQTEANNSVATIKSMQFYGFLASKPKNQKLYIEFIGDSITCGYGNLWTKDSADPSSKSGTALYQDATQSYAYLTAQLLQADVSLVSCSGIGVDLGYTNQNGSGYRMMDFYKAASYARNQKEEFDFAAARVPDVVVINLGTNDQSLNSTEANFKAGVKELIEFIRTSYGKNVPIVWAYGMMADGRYQWVQSVLEEMGGTDAKLYSFELVRNKEGGNGHPSLTAHNIAAQQLTGFLIKNNIVDY